MARSYSLAYLTAARLSPPQAIELAAELGYGFVGLRPLPGVPGGAAQPLHTDPVLLADTAAAVRGTGVGVWDLEIIRLNPATDPLGYEAFFEAGERLGARAVLVGGDDPDMDRATANFAALCERAAVYGLTCDLEFMPWTPVCNCATAARIVAAAAQPNARLLVDALHFGRSRTTLADIAALPREWLGYAQICDAPPGIPATDAGLIFTARSERQLPGEGGIDLAGLFGVLPADIPVSVEVPSDTRIPALGEREWARQALDAARGVLSAIGRA